MSETPITIGIFGSYKPQPGPQLCELAYRIGSELGLIRERVNKGFISPRPLVIVGKFWALLLRTLAESRKGGDRLVHCAQTAADVAVIFRRRAAYVTDDAAR